MSCANNVLPVYMWPSPGKIPEALCLPPVQVDTVHFSSEATETNGFSRLSSSLNRTAVLPGVCHLAVLWSEFVTPDKFCAVQSAARREFPLGLSRQGLACPTSVSLCVFERDLYDGMIQPPGNRAALAFRMPPIRARLPFPPV